MISSPLLRRYSGLIAATTLTLSSLTHADMQDPHLWLEGVEDPAALQWVESRNKIALDTLTSSERYEEIYDGLLEIYNSSDKIPSVAKYGDHYYNFWQDADHVRGIWRRCSPDSYATDNPNWETVLDIDALAEAEDVSWVWKGSVVQDLDYTRALIVVSDGGQDASEYREFDLTEKTFVTSGFKLSTGRNRAGWIDANTLLVGAFPGDDDATDSGYPRRTRIWQRGTPIADAAIVHEIDPKKVGAFLAISDNVSGRQRLIHEAVTAFETAYWLIGDDHTLSKIEVPPLSDIAFFQDQLLIELKSDWTIGTITYPIGSLVSTNLEEFQSGKRNFKVLFEPEVRASLESFTTTRNHVVLNLLDNVSGRLSAWHYDSGHWHQSSIDTPSIGSVSARAIDSDHSDEIFVTTSSFLSPSTLHRQTVGETDREVLKTTPSYFDQTGMVMTQHEATAPDGTRIPYFQVAQKGIKLDGSNPTLLYGYGGFQISMKPGYTASWGRSWMARGGVFILANIRGGGEFGPAWHQAALKGNRQVSWNDFIAIGEDLVARKVTSPRHLGIMGGSQGGLLMGVMYTQRPDLWGAVVCQVPLLDMLRFHKLLAGASWVGEYGDPEIPEERKFIAKYSPYQNVAADKKYPPILFVTSTHDDRVHPGHARKMAARLEEHGHEFLYWENTEGGHGGAANNAERSQLHSLGYEFLWQKLSAHHHQ
jgi:prolyl oligopeptidase